MFCLMASEGAGRPHEMKRFVFKAKSDGTLKKLVGINYIVAVSLLTYIKVLASNVAMLP